MSADRAATAAVRRAGASRPSVLALVALGSLVLGLGVGRAAAPDRGAVSRAAVEVAVLTLALDADAIWTSGAEGLPAVADGVAALLAGEPEPVREHGAAWAAAHDSVLVRLAGVDLPSEARPVQRQLVAAVTLSRDAVDVLRRAADVPAGAGRDDLVVEVARLRQRSEELLLAARASVDDLDGARRRVTLLPAVPPFADPAP